MKYAQHQEKRAKIREQQLKVQHAKQKKGGGTGSKPMVSPSTHSGQIYVCYFSVYQFVVILMVEYGI